MLEQHTVRWQLMLVMDSRLLIKQQTGLHMTDILSLRDQTDFLTILSVCTSKNLMVKRSLMHLRLVVLLCLTNLVSTSQKWEAIASQITMQLVASTSIRLFLPNSTLCSHKRKSTFSTSVQVLTSDRIGTKAMTGSQSGSISTLRVFSPVKLKFWQRTTLQLKQSGTQLMLLSILPRKVSVRILRKRLEKN